MATPDYGTAVDLRDDVPGGRWRFVSGHQNLANAVYRRVTTDRGALKRHPDFGRNLRDVVGDAASTATLRAEERAFAREVEKDERVARCAVTFDFNSATETLTATFAVQPVGSGSFTLVLAVTAVSVTVLNLSPLT